MHHRNENRKALVKVVDQSVDSLDQHESSEANQQECAGNQKLFHDKRADLSCVG